MQCSEDIATFVKIGLGMTGNIILRNLQIILMVMKWLEQFSRIYSTRFNYFACWYKINTLLDLYCTAWIFYSKDSTWHLPVSLFSCLTQFIHIQNQKSSTLINCNDLLTQNVSDKNLWNCNHVELKTNNGLWRIPFWYNDTQSA